MKIASFEIVDLPLIRKAASAGVPIILSTGMAVYGEIEDALGAVAEAGNEQVALLRCASVYPAPPDDHEPALDGDDARGVRRARRPLGPHARASRSRPAPPRWAWTCWRSTSRSRATMEGPDHPFAIEPDELRALVARRARGRVGAGQRAPRGPVRGRARRDVPPRPPLADRRRDIPAGTEITAAMLTVKRPGYGIAPKHLDARRRPRSRASTSRRTTSSPGRWCRCWPPASGSGLREICAADVGERYVGWLNDPVIAQFLESRFATADVRVGAGVRRAAARRPRRADARDRRGRRRCPRREHQDRAAVATPRDGRRRAADRRARGVGARVRHARRSSSRRAWASSASGRAS